MATLKNLVDETTNIKNELKTCHTNLKNNLIDKGVDVSSGDKLSALVDKIKNIKTVSFNVGETTTLYNNTETEMIKGTTYTYFNKEYIFICDGNFRLSAEMQSTGSATAYLKMQLLDSNGSVLQEKEFSNTTMTYVRYTLDCNSVKSGYRYKILGRSSSSSYGIRVNNFSVKCDIDFD